MGFTSGDRLLPSHVAGWFFGSSAEGRARRRAPRLPPVDSTITAAQTERAFDLRVLGSELAGIDVTAGEACVCDLQTDVGVAPNLLSYHLKALREAGVVPLSPRARGATVR